MDYASNQKYIAIGISFRKHYSILDKIGSIVDHILYSDGAYFNPTFFPKTMTSHEERILFNDITKNSLTITPSNIILEFNSSADCPQDFPEIFKAYKEFVFRDIFMKHKISGLSRIGFVFGYRFEDVNVLDKLNAILTRGIADDVDTSLLRLTKKIPTIEGVVKRGIDDFKNSIIEISKTQASNCIKISIDYQQYYSPFLDIYEEKDLNDIADYAKAYNRKFLDKILGDKDE